MNMKRFFYFSLIYLLSVVALSCSKVEQGPARIQFAVGGAPGELHFWETIAADFESKTGIGVDILRQPTDTDQRRQGLVVAMNSKSKNPDVFLMDVAWIAQFSASAWLAGLDEFIARDSMELDVFFQPVLNTVDQWNGERIALPVYIDGGLLYYRKDLLERFGYAGAPQTWHDLVNVSLDIQAQMRPERSDFYGFVWQGAQYEGLICNFLEFAASNGGGVAIQAGKVYLESPANVQALRTMRALIHDFKISPPNTFTEMKEEESRLYFQEGNALFERNWPYAWLLHQMEGSAVKDKVGIAVLPHFGNRKSVSTMGGWHIGISGFSDHVSEAWEFLKFIVSKETQKKMVLELGWNPGRQDLYDDPDVLEKLPHLKQLKAVFQKTIPRPFVPYYSQISEVLQKHVNAVLADSLEASEGLRQAESEIQAIVDRYQEVS